MKQILIIKTIASPYGTAFRMDATSNEPGYGRQPNHHLTSMGVLLA